MEIALVVLFSALFIYSILRKPSPILDKQIARIKQRSEETRKLTRIVDQYIASLGNK